MLLSHPIFLISHIATSYLVMKFLNISTLRDENRADDVFICQPFNVMCCVLN